MDPLALVYVYVHGRAKPISNTLEGPHIAETGGGGGGGGGGGAKGRSIPSCPCFVFVLADVTPCFSFHFPHFHLSTTHRHHSPTLTMKWLVVHTMTLTSALV
jgi:hypothetical protein